jgi:ribonuclease HI
MQTHTTSTRALPLVASGLPDDVIVTAHTDGACSGNPGPGGWSVVYSAGGTILTTVAGSAADTTNNQMELTAVVEAIRHAPSHVALNIITDSKNVIGWVLGTYRRKNPDIAALCREIDTLRASRLAPVTFQHVRGHKGDALNEMADGLATAAIRKH